MRKYEFERYVRGYLMAEGAIVHADSEESALQKATALFARSAKGMDVVHTEFKLISCSAGEERHDDIR